MIVNTLLPNHQSLRARHCPAVGQVTAAPGMHACSDGAVSALQQKPSCSKRRGDPKTVSSMNRWCSWPAASARWCPRWRGAPRRRRRPTSRQHPRPSTRSSPPRRPPLRSSRRRCVLSLPAVVIIAAWPMLPSARFEIHKKKHGVVCAACALDDGGSAAKQTAPSPLGPA